MKTPSRLSYSSLNSYAECGRRWLLERGHRLSGGTWWATIAGSAIHELTEDYDRGKASAESVSSAEAFELVLTKYELEAKKRGDEIKASGSMLKKHGKTGGPNKKDRDWWLIEGPQMVESYVAWRKLSRWEILTLWDGTPGIEVKLDIEVAGRKFLGFIDRIFVTPTGEMVIVDIKSGKEPAGKVQLATYRMGLLRQYGLDITTGAYWMAGSGSITSVTDLEAFPLEQIEAMVQMAWTGIEAGVFLPTVTSMCSGCGVREYCPGVGGAKAGEIPLFETVEVGPPSTKKNDVALVTLA